MKNIFLPPKSKTNQKILFFLVSSIFTLSSMSEINKISLKTNALPSQSLRTTLQTLLVEVVNEISVQGQIDLPNDFVPKIEIPPEFSMGQYSSPLAMELAKVFKKKPRDIAENIQALCEQKEIYNKLITKSEIAGPGFLNFFVNPSFLGWFFSKDFSANNWIDSLFKENKNPSVLFEFVSANPTGPLNIVSARAACVGDSICRLLRKAKIKTHAEYYVNDYGNQIELLGLSFAYRYLQYIGLPMELPEDCYQGEYIRTLMIELLQEQELPPNLAFQNIAEITEDMLDDVTNGLKDFFAPLAIEKLLNSHKNDLQKFRVYFDNFFSEATLHKENKVQETFERLQKTSYIYKQDGAYFFKSTEFGDDKDRVVLRADGRYTYLMADIAYHLSKIDRGFTRLYDIWGPDHHGYIARLHGALKALGFEKQKEEKFSVLIVQQVNMIENGKPVVMSKRLGKFQTMKDLTDAIPIDVSRYFFVARSQSSHLDFDLDLALTQSNQNPVYYIQYAHARVYSIFREAHMSVEQKIEVENFTSFLNGHHRDSLFFLLLQFPDHIEDIAQNLEIHRLATYLYKVANEFTSFYHQKENRVKAKIATDKKEAEFLLRLCAFTANVLAQGLDILGITAPKEM